jgi:hypothetical protein
MLLVVHAPAWANMGIPMLMLAWPAYVLGLAPIIVLESLVGTRDLGLPWRKILPVVAVGNLWSTLLGIPVVWAGLFAIEAVVGIAAATIAPTGDLDKWLFPFFVAWLPPIENIWIVYAAFAVLAVPFCIASIWIEAKVALRKLPAQPPDKVRAWIRRANVWSYVFMVACFVAFPLSGT